jgi:hypothetical protein
MRKRNEAELQALRQDVKTPDIEMPGTEIREGGQEK